MWKVSALVVLGLVSLAVGALALPSKKRPAPAAGPVANNEKKIAAEKPYVAPDPEASVDVNGARIKPTSFDLPRIAPQLPAGAKAMALAGLIDREVDAALARANVPASPLAGDAEFIRRVYLDLTGRIPPRDKVVAFLDSDDPYKRARLIDELLASPAYGQHFARIWADLLVKRDFDSNKNLKTGPYIDWMAEQFNKNRPWGQIVSDMVTASGPEASVPPTFFVAANQDNKQPSAAKLVGATSNLFMGIQLQCAECHRHPFTARWDMKDFWGMAAFYGHTRFDRPPGKKKNGPAKVVEVERLPVLNKRGKLAKGPRAKQGASIGLAIGVPDPTDPRRILRIAPGRFFESNKPLPTGTVPYRPHLAAWLTSGENPYFARATVNRWWAHFFARGLVSPIEDMSPDNKASHPALLATLADELTRSGHDLRYLIKAICNSKAYQRTSRPLQGNKTDEKLLSHMAVKVMSPHQLLESLVVVTNVRITAPAQMKGKGKKQAEKSVTGTGGNPLVRFFDTREYDDDPTEFTYGIPQLLRLMNSNLTNSSEAVAARLAKVGDRPRVIEEMYLLALARRPSAAEVERISAYVRRHSNPVKGYAGALWALLNSAEFISVR